MRRNRFGRRMLLGFVALLGTAFPPAAHATFVGLEAEYHVVSIGGVDHGIIEVFTVFDSPTNTVLQVFNAKYTLTGAPGSAHLDLFDGTWAPQFALTLSDSFCRIGGSIGFQNSTNADPLWGPNGFTAPEIPANAGWFNGSPPNLQGQAGPDLKTPISRHMFVLAGTVTLTVEGTVTYNNGLGTPAFQASFSATFVQPGDPGEDDCASAAPLATWIPLEYHTHDAVQDGPSPCGGMAADRWFTYAAPVTGWATVSTCDADFESVIAVYEGCACPASAANLIACADCCCGPSGTQVSFLAQGGQCYLIQLGGEFGAVGSGTILVEQQLDDCNGDGVADAFEIQQDFTRDCDGNGQLDECQLPDGDEDGSGVLDVCEHLPTVIMGPVVNPANCHRYYLLDRSNWTLSQEAAERLGGTLAIVDDADENAWIWATFSSMSNHLWIGLTDEAQEGAFVWIDGTSPTFTNWSPFEPNNYLDEDYAHMWPEGGGQWNDSKDLAYAAARAVVEVSLVADLNGDGIVDGSDLGLLLAGWGGGDAALDLDCSGVVDGGDLGQLLAAWD